MATTYGIVGAGIVGLAVAYQLQQLHPGCKVIVLEKESSIGQHQSGNNSGVLHCGLYYQPGSLKAQLAVEGIRSMTNFCQQYNIPHEICGKIVVATNAAEERALDELHRRGTANGLAGLEFLDAAALKAREPYVFATKTLLVPQEGIVDYKAVMQQLKQLIEANGGGVLTNIHIDKVVESADKVAIHTHSKTWLVDRLVACAGLQADRVYESFTGKKSPIKIVPFRGEYLSLKPAAAKYVNHLVYPVPDATYPFLGVHFTRMIHGEREVGPNAVFATKREGYKNTDFSLSDTMESLTYKGFFNFLRKNFRFSMNEFFSSLSKSAFLKKAQKMIPALQASDLTKGNAGVRAQAMNQAGELVMDFNIVQEGRQIHVLNAPSPGATASLSIAKHIVRQYIQMEEK